VFTHKSNTRQKLMLKIVKSEGPISSGLVTVKGTVGSDEDVLPPVKWRLT
jgi:hypothetical protein